MTGITYPYESLPADLHIGATNQVLFRVRPKELIRPTCIPCNLWSFIPTWSSVGLLVAEHREYAEDSHALCPFH